MNNVVQGANALGEFFLLSLDKDTYSREAIMKTCYAFTDNYFIHVVKVADNATGIYFYSKVEGNDEQHINAGVRHFLHLLNENQMRQIIHYETAALHEEIIKKAFAPAVSLIEKESQMNSLNILKSSV